jgi:hypothetical protein
MRLVIISTNSREITSQIDALSLVLNRMKNVEVGLYGPESLLEMTYVYSKLKPKIFFPEFGATVYISDDSVFHFPRSVRWKNFEYARARIDWSKKNYLKRINLPSFKKISPEKIMKIANYDRKAALYSRVREVSDIFVNNVELVERYTDYYKLMALKTRYGIFVSPPFDITELLERVMNGFDEHHDGSVFVMFDNDKTPIAGKKINYPDKLYDLLE